MGVFNFGRKNTPNPNTKQQQSKGAKGGSKGGKSGNKGTTKR